MVTEAGLNFLEIFGTQTVPMAQRVCNPDAKKPQAGWLGALVENDAQSNA